MQLLNAFNDLLENAASARYSGVATAACVMQLLSLAWWVLELWWRGTG